MASVLIQQVWQAAAHRADEVAVAQIHEGGVVRSLTWHELQRAAATWAEHLAGSSPRPVVLLAAPNCVQYMVAFLGTMLADATVFSISPTASERELRRAIVESGVTIAVGDEKTLACVADAVRVVDLADVPLDGGDEAARRITDQHRGEGSLLLYSSGTTGLPKIIRRSAAALDAVGINCRDAVGMSGSDSMLTVVPICHSYAIDHAVMGAMIAGTRVDLLSRFEPRELLVTAAARRATLLPGVPFIFDMLGQCDAAPPGLSLRSVYSAGGPLPRAVWDAFARRFGLRIGQIYGSSEFASVTWNDPHEADIEPLSAGRPMCGVEIRILDRDRPDVDRPLPPGVEGHVAVAAPSMLSEYVGREEPHARLGDFFLSGDLGRLDHAGRLHLTGRLKLLIDVGGQKVNPLEVEATLKEFPGVPELPGVPGCPGVAEAIVLPVAVTQTVNRVKAVIVWRDGAGGGDLEALRRFARERLSPHKLPRYFEARTSLPRSPTGKVLRHLVEATT